MPVTKIARHDAESLQRIADHLREMAVEIDSVITTMKTDGIPGLEITHQGALEVGLKGIAKFANACNQSARDWLLKNGGFEAGGSKPEKPKKTPKK